MLALVPMRAEEFSRFFEAVSMSHANDCVAAERWSAGEATDLSREELKRLLPRNEETADNYLFVLEDADLKLSIGYLWFGDMARAGKKLAYLYQLYIHPQYRRQGYGREAMRAFEEKATSRGYDALALHVFAANERAHRLYQTLGYAPSSVTMRKELPLRGA